MEKAQKWIIIGIILLLAVTVAFIVGASLFPEFRIISRDIAIVVLAVFAMVAFLLIITLLIAVLYVVKSINRLTQETIIPKINATNVKIDEILENTRAITNSVRESAGTANTTTVFVAERVASPIIRVSSLVAGVRAAATSLAHRGQPAEPDAESNSTAG